MINRQAMVPKQPRQHNFQRKGLGPGGTQTLYEAGSE